jgi:hypothetical protein
MNEPSDLASRPTRMIEAGVLFGIAIDAIRSIKADPRKGGQRSARTVAAVVNEVCSGTSRSDFQKTLTFINQMFQSYIAGIF